MEKETDCDLSIESANNSVTRPALLTNVTLSEDDLSEEAKAQFAFHTDILHEFQLNARVVLANDRLTPIGRHLFCTSIEQNYMNCKNVLNYVAAHPELKMTIHPMPPLFVLCGIARTGSTLLYSLLACDPTCRAPLLLDMTHPIPPIARSDTAAQEQRNIIARTFYDNLKDLQMANYEPELLATHPRHKYEEDMHILFQSGLSVPHLEPHDSTELATWFYNETNKDFAYEYHKTFLKMLNSVDAPQSHWLLKAPYHAFNLNTLLRHYPSVSLIMTHRRLQEVVPSSIRMGLAVTNMYFDRNRHDTAIDRQMIVERRLRVVDVHTDRIVKFRRAHSHCPVFDVFYDDLMAKPIDTVRRIYNHFGLTWSEEFEQAMLTWLQNNPQGKHGRNTYSLEEYGLTHDAIEERYKDYIKMFFSSQVPLKTEDNMMKSMNSSFDKADIVTN